MRRRTLRDLWTAIRKLAAGLPPGGEAVWPGVRSDLFVAHESLYRFAARRAAGRRVLDAACGTGYGSELLARAGAASVVGVDRHRGRLRFAARRYRAPGLAFRFGDCAALDFAPGSFDLVVSSNTLEHLAEPRRFLDGVERALAAGGELMVAVPPVVSAADLELHRDNEDHLSSLTVRQWAELFDSAGWRGRYFAHRCAAPLDFASSAPSRVGPEAFRFDEESTDAAGCVPSLTAVWWLSRA